MPILTLTLTLAADALCTSHHTCQPERRLRARPSLGQGHATLLQVGPLE